MEQCVDLWRPIRKWAKTVQNTEPEVLVGGITYHRQDDGVVFNIPIRFFNSHKLTEQVPLVVSENGELFFPSVRFRELYKRKTLFKRVFEDESVQQVVVELPIISLYFTSTVYQPDLDAILVAHVCLELNFLSNDFSVLVGFDNCDWNRKFLGEMLSKTIKRGDTDDTEA